ncbi:MAG: hypothetical protein KC656_37155, partial [Myxococcales bacterium]|nr:hypothetical protein [Myxococcales bacterium]
MSEHGAHVSSPPPRVSASVWPRRLAVALAAVAVTALGAAWVARGWAQDFGYNLFTDRDLARGLLLPVDGVTPGAELSGGSGARVPGWITPVVFGLPQLLVGAGARPVQVL